MRCQRCGADIGEKKVCPFCETPIRNVLITKPDKEYSSHTKMMNSICEPEQTGIITSFDKELKERKKISFRSIDEEIDNEMKEKEFQQDDVSVISDICVERSKCYSKKYRVIKFTILGICILILILLIIFAALSRKYHKYIDELKDIEVVLYEDGEDIYSPDVIWEEIEGENKFAIRNKMSEAEIEVEIPEYEKFVHSTKGLYGAYKCVDSYTHWVEDNSENGKHQEVVYIYKVFLVTEFGEKIKLVDVEKANGKIDLIGVTDNGNIIYTDTEQESTFVVSQSSSLKLDSIVRKMLVYQDGTCLIIDKDSQMSVIKLEQTETEISDKVISSSVQKLYFLDSKGKYGILKEVDGIISTDSESLTIVYENYGCLYANNLGQVMQNSRRISEEQLIVDQKTFLDDDLQTVEIGRVNLNGEGEVYIGKKNFIYYRLGMYRRRIAMADKIIGLVGTKVYYIRDGKMYKTDVFTLESEELCDHQMNIILE